MATTPVIWDSFNSYTAPAEIGSHFAVSGTAAVNQVAARSRTGNGSLVLAGSTGIAGGASLVHTGLAAAYVVVNAAYYIAENPSSNRTVIDLQVGSTTKARAIVLTTGAIRLDVALTEVDAGAVTINPGEINYFELVYHSHATTGSLFLYLNGVLAASFTGDTVGAAGNVEAVRFRSPHTSTNLASVSRANLSDVVVATVTGTPTAADARLGAVAHSVIVPTSDITVAGTPSTGTDNFAMVDEVPNDGDTTYVELALVDDSDLYGHTSTLPADTVPLGVAVFSIQRLPTGGTTQVRHMINDGTTTVNGSDLGVGGDYAVNASFWDESPFGTPGPWTKAAAEALRFGVEARS